jgi:tellurite resistance protein TehA-like permease
VLGPLIFVSRALWFSPAKISLSLFLFFFGSVRHLGKYFTSAADFHFPLGGLLISAQELGRQFDPVAA